jgi:hypothetical protein
VCVCQYSYLNKYTDLFLPRASLCISTHLEVVYEFTHYLLLFCCIFQWYAPRWFLWDPWINLHVFKFTLSAFEIFCRSTCEGMAIACVKILFFSWLQMFFLFCCALNWTSPTVHLCSTLGFYGDSLSLLCPWWGKDNFPCCAKCFCIYHEPATLNSAYRQ